ncbi:hypothetical protein [Raineyella fluvialis]|uniref:Uncharacterized protein n=1 Tax=Raineyella fluvialis TaxID=2662261 RepID=A0A5Q2FA89_9ACTN|nr:hypothetical protein [Raineyella fluvialis]QGF23598.1 hypothetical protein Rai3103_07875 [Raineyella fluvialis]
MDRMAARIHLDKLRDRDFRIILRRRMQSSHLEHRIVEDYSGREGVLLIQDTVSEIELMKFARNTIHKWTFRIFDDFFKKISSRQAREAAEWVGVPLEVLDDLDLSPSLYE